MTNSTRIMRPRVGMPANLDQPVSTQHFDWAATILSGALVGGAYLDAWAHERGYIDQSFFTPWHGILYSAMLATGIFLLVPFVRNLARGYSWRHALPVGYGTSLLGVFIFTIAGSSDMIWHTLFGIEKSIEALLSPPHLLLALAWVLIVGGPFRAAWQHLDDLTGAALLPAVVSLAWTLSAFTFFSVYASPFMHVLAAQGAPSGDEVQALGVVAFLVQSALLMGVILLAVRRWKLPFGSLTLLFTLNTALVVTLHDLYPMILVAAVSGLGADLLLQWLRPSAERPLAFRAFAFAVPALLYSLYFTLLLFSSGIAWTTHLWTGTIVLAGAIGFLLSYAFVPPTIRRNT